MRNHFRISTSVALISTLFLWPGLTNLAYAGSPSPCYVVAAGVLIDGSNCSGEVVIDDSVTSIGEDAFKNNSGLTSIIIPSSVNAIGRAAFWGTSLTAVVIPSSVESISDELFRTTASLTSVTIPSSVTTIGSFAFDGTGLTSVTIPSEVKTIGRGAFRNTRLISIVIPNGLTSLGAETFQNAVNLVSVVLPDSLMSLDDSLFLDASALTNVKFPKYLTHIGRAVFVNTAITSVTIPGTVAQIDQYAFAYMPNLKTAVIENGVTRLLYGVFSNDPLLTTLVIPNSVTSIGYAFEIDSSDPDGSYNFQTIFERSTALKCAVYPEVTFLGGWGYMETYGDVPLCPVAAITSNSDSVLKAAAEAAAAKQEADRQAARVDLAAKLRSSSELSVESFSKAEIPGVTSSNIALVQAEILALPELSRTDINQVLKIARKYEVVGNIGSDQIKYLPPALFIEIGLIPTTSKNKVALVGAIKKLPTAARDSFIEIKSAIDAEIIKIQARKDRLAAVLTRNATRNSR